MKDMKLCKDCKWIERKWFVDVDNSRCTNPKVSLSPTYGPVSGMHKLCIHERDIEVGDCGPPGKYFEARN